MARIVPCPFDGCPNTYIAGMHNDHYINHIHREHVLCACGRYFTLRARRVHVETLMLQGEWGRSHPPYDSPSKSPQARRDVELYRLEVSRLARGGGG